MKRAIPPPEGSDLERQNFWQGQMLCSRDFRSQLRVSDQYRWWHNRAMHHAFGIVRGFEIETQEGGILIHPGVAYDCFGREIVSLVDRFLPFKKAHDAMILFVRYERDAQFFWRSSKEEDPYDAVPIARVSQRGKKAKRDNAFSLPFSRAITRPRILSGSTIPRATQWELGPRARNDEEVSIEFKVRIDTSSGGFTQVPCYFAWLQTPKTGPERDQFLSTSFTHVDQPTLDSFTFRLLLRFKPDFLREKASEFLAFQQELFVIWLAVQAFPSESAKEVIREYS